LTNVLYPLIAEVIGTTMFLYCEVFPIHPDYMLGRRVDLRLVLSLRTLFHQKILAAFTEVILLGADNSTQFILLDITE
jgi:hypothetical protein